MELNVRLRKFLPLLLIILAFAAPMLMAYIALIFQDKIKQNTSSYGQLMPIIEQVSLQKFEKLLAVDNTPAHKWQLVFVTPPSCDTDCNRRKEMLIKLHALLRDDKARVEVLSAMGKEIIPHKEAGQIILLDPNNYHVLSYEQTAEPSGILKDLMRLLKYSNV